MKEKIQEFGEEMSSMAKKPLSYAFLIIEVFLSILALKNSTRGIMAVPVGIVLLLCIFLYMLCKDTIQYEDRLVYNYTRRTAFTFVLAIFMLLGIFASKGFEKIGILFYGVLLIVGYIFAFIAVFSESGTEVINAIIQTNFYELGNSKKRRKGDWQVGYEVEKTVVNNRGEKEALPNYNKPIIVPKNDRYVHVLALGATGTGKTSQVLLPMIHNDLKDNMFGVIVIDPKGDFAEQAYALGVMCDRKPVHFDPALRNCPYFNPLRGAEVDVIEDIVTTFGAFDSDSSQFFQTNNENLLRRAVKVLKRLKGDDATMIDLETLCTNVGGKGMQMIKEFDKLAFKDPTIMQENKTISAWFREDYYTGISGGRQGTKTYEQTSGVRNQISKLVSNRYLRRILNPPKTSSLKKGEYIDFDEILANGDVLCLSTNEGKLRDLSRYLGYFIILQLESAIFRRPGNAKTRKGCVLCIDEFQTYANPGFADVLTKGRSYRVSAVLATQNRGLIGMNSGKKAASFTQLVTTNCRNVVLFPDANMEDAEYYSKQFGEIMQEKTKQTTNKLKYGMDIMGERISVSTDEKAEKRFTPSDIIYQPFKQVICKTIKNNNVQEPVRARIEFIDKKIDSEMEAFLADYKLNNMLDDGETPVIEAGDINIDAPIVNDEFDILGDEFDIDLSNIEPDTEEVKKEGSKKDPNVIEDIFEEDDF